MAEFRMPTLGSDMTAGTLLAWHKGPGDAVRRGDIIAEVETDKADIEVETFVEGVVERLLVEPGTRVPVGTPIAIIRGEHEPAVAEGPAAQAPPPSTLAPAPPNAPAATTGALTPPPPHPPAPREVAAGERVRATPVARQLAAELRVDLATVVGTGPGGRIQQRDVEEAAAAARAAAAGQAAGPPTPPAAPADRQARMRQAIAAAMLRSHREIPQFHLTTTIDFGRAMAWLSETNARRPVAERLLYGVLLLKAVARAVQAVPELNAVWADGQAQPRPEVHVGMAISLRGGGLVAPALHHTDRQSLDELMRGFRDLVQRARAGSLRSSELTDPTITVTSLGEQGAEAVYGLIYQPQVALVGFGRVAAQPWSVDGQIVSRPLVTATLTADHRVVDGHRGSVFLAAIDRLLQEPSEL